MQVNVVVFSVAIITDNCTAWNAGNGRREAVIDTDFESSGIE